MRPLEFYFRPVLIETYNPGWPDEAFRISKKLSALLKFNILRVEHIGSTSIPSLAAKPIIDLIPIVKDIHKLDEQKDLLLNEGYLWHGEMGIAGRRFCTLSSPEGIRKIHLHFFQSGDPHIQRHVAFREYLIGCPEVAKQYEEVKKKAAHKYPFDHYSYSQAKSFWIRIHEKKAIEWWANEQNIRVF